MNHRFHAVAALAAALACCLTPSSVAAKSKHHHAVSADAPAPSHHHHSRAQEREAHLARLAARQKAAWRAHLAKVRELPPKQRRAVRRHDHKVANLHQEHLVQAEEARRQHLRRLKRLAERQADQEQTAARRHRHHDAPTRQASSHPAPHPAKPSAHARRLAEAQAAHDRRVAAANAAHAARVKAQASRVHAAQQTHLARAEAAEKAHQARLHARQARLAQQAMNHQARVAKAKAAHDARLAARRAHWVALHGDGSGGRSIKFWQTVAANVPVKVITVDLNDDNVKISAVMAQRGEGTSEPFRQMIQRANPNVAVTGTFFSLDNLKPVGDIVIDGSLIHFGGMGTALCITPGNHADMVTCDWGRHHDWSPYDFVVACGPRLLSRGAVVLDPRAERFRDRHMLAPNSRIAVGITPGNKIVFAMTHKPIYLGRMAKVMRSLGAKEAMNLDAGTSTGFYYNGTTLAKPGRKLTNMIVVYGHKDQYRRALDQLVPSSYHRAPTRYERRASAR